MSFGSLTVVCAVALLGPLLALPLRWHLPVVLGELVAGAAVGRTGVGIVDARDGTFAFLANIGFALVMFVAGTHVPVRDLRLRGALRIGLARAAGVAALACIPAVLLANIFFHTGHAALYAVLMASSSAALILPIVDGLGLAGNAVLQLLPQVAIADALCVVALPLAIDPRHAARATLGAGLVLVATAALYVLLRWLEGSGLRKRVHRVSERRKFAIEMRVSLVILFALAALAQAAHVSVLLAGFCLGLAVAAVGEPRRLARQLFALTEGFLGPLFFVWLGAALDVRALATDLRSAVLAVALGLGAVLVHVAMRLTGQPFAYGGLAAAQLGVPVAAATLGTQLGLLRPAEAAALIAAAMLTIAVAAWSAAGASRAPASTP